MASMTSNINGFDGYLSEPAAALDDALTYLVDVVMSSSDNSRDMKE
jgi:hypothetical protein